MISQPDLDKLKALFHKDGIEITNAEALEIGLWLMNRLRPILIPLTPEQRNSLKAIKEDMDAYRTKHPWVNLRAWREKNRDHAKDTSL